MANPDEPRGFQPHGIPKDCYPYEYKLAAANSTIRIGDVLKIVNDGYVDLAAAGDGSIACGIAAEYRGAAAGAVAATNRIMVWDDPRMIFEAQLDGDTAYAVTDNFELTDHVATAGGDIYSAHELDVSGLGTSEAQFRIIGMVRAPNNTLGASATVLCQFAEHYKLSTTGIVGT